jgi:hypothetical protein
MYQAIALKSRVQVWHKYLMFGNVKIGRIKTMTADIPHEAGQ